MISFPGGLPFYNWSGHSFWRVETASVNLWSRHTSVTCWAPETMIRIITPDLCKPWGNHWISRWPLTWCRHQPVGVDLEVSRLRKSGNADALGTGDIRHELCFSSICWYANHLQCLSFLNPCARVLPICRESASASSCPMNLSWAPSDRKASPFLSHLIPAGCWRFRFLSKANI